MPNFEPKKGKLYFVKTETHTESVWTGFTKVHNYKTVTKPIINFVHPEDETILTEQERFCNVPLFFLSCKRKVTTRNGHADLNHWEELEGACVVYDYVPRGGPPNDWDIMQHKSADVEYQYCFLFEKQIIAVKIPANKSFGEFFHEATVWGYVQN